MADELRITASGVDSISAAHQSALARLDGATASLADVDGGYATAELNAILGAVLTAALDLSAVNDLTARHVAALGRDMERSDEAVARWWSASEGQ